MNHELIVASIVKHLNEKLPDFHLQKMMDWHDNWFIECKKAPGEYRYITFHENHIGHTNNPITHLEDPAMLEKLYEYFKCKTL